MKSGFTLVELLITLAVGMLILSLSFSVVISNKSVYDLDAARTSVNQNLRAGLDILSSDLRQAGERLGGDFPAVEVQQGVGAAPDTLTLRKSLIDDVLPVCANVTGANVDVWVAQQPLPALPSTNIDCLLSSTGLASFRAQRLLSSGMNRVYIYDPVNVRGEFLKFTGDDANTGGGSTKMNVSPESGSWLFTYLASNQPRIYLIEERLFKLNTANKDIVVRITGGLGSGEPNEQPIVTSIEDFQASAYLDALPSPLLSNGNGAISGGVWKSLAFVRLTMKGERQRGAQKSVIRTLTDDILPRNVLSR